MNRETLISIINKNGIRFLPVRRCSLCNEYIGYKFVRMCDGSMIPVFSSGCGCCGVNNGQLFERTWDEMLDFINSVFGHEDMINNSITLENIGYHKIGSIFKYNIGSKEVELEVVESSDASCEGCVFNNSKNYYCKDTHCIDVDRKDDIDVIYKEVKRS